MSFTRAKVLLRRFLNKKGNREIEPDEIFLDSSNLPEFDTHQFEGRLERPISKHMQTFVALVFILMALAYMGRIGYLQIERGEALAYLSENNRLQHSVIFAERGVIYDRNGVELVWNEGGNDFPLRKYSTKNGLAQVLGYVGYPLKDSRGVYYRDEFIGKDGIESVFNERLSGKNGLEIEEVDALQKVQSKSTIRPPQDGENVTLSVDERLQEGLYNLIRDRARESGFDGGGGVVMDVATGEILTLVSYPEYDSQVLTDGAPQEAIASFVSDKRKPFLNRVVSGLYTPGSIVKPIVAVGALSEGVITPEKKILSTGSIRVPHPYLEDEYSVFVDWKAHGWVALRDAIALSSNVYFYEIGGGFEGQSGIGIEGINKYARMFGLGEKTYGPFVFEPNGVIPNPQWKEATFDGDPWRVGDTYNTAIGQYGFQVTPIQMARAISAIANGGMLLTPQIEKGADVEKEELPLSLDDIRIVREGMRQGVQSGTAQALSVPFVSVAAKTGTAQLGTTKQYVHSWVVGFFPYEKPRYAFVILMEKGAQSNLVGAASVGRAFLEWLANNTPEYLSNE